MPSISNNLLELKNVTKIYYTGRFRKRSVVAVRDVSFSIPEENPIVTALVGESGSGKSTIARLILGLLEPTCGTIFYRGKEVREWLKKEPSIYRREVQAIFQDPYSIYNPFYKIDRVFKIAIKKFKLASSNEQAQELIEESMRAIGLRPRDLLGRYPHQLSGGERQRLMLARIFLIKPKLLIADEPVSMIDVSLRSIFLENLLKLKDDLKMSCLYITHDLNIANFVSSNIIVLCLGKIVEMGKTRSVIEKPKHPYTKILVRAIPNPNPKERWKDKMPPEVVLSKSLRREQGCVFLDRCPEAIPACKESDPPLLEIEPGHRVACHLYATSGK